MQIKVFPEKTIHRYSKYFKEVEGVRPRVNDPRADAKLRVSLTKGELIKQEEAFKAWKKELNDTD